MTKAFAIMSAAVFFIVLLVFIEHLWHTRQQRAKDRADIAAGAARRCPRFKTTCRRPRCLRGEFSCQKDLRI